jgi:hypothetical protein
LQKEKLEQLSPDIITSIIKQKETDDAFQSIENVPNEFKNQKVSLVSSNAIIYENGIAVSRYFNKKFYEITTKTLLKNNLIVNSSVILRATALKLIDGYVSDFHVRGMEDYATWLRVSRIGQISYINKCLIGYTRSPDSFGEQMGQSKLPYLLSEFNEWKSKLSLKEI